MDVGSKFLLLCLIIIGTVNGAEIYQIAVGQIFSHRLVGEDKISTDGLPSWMSFDPSQATIFGIPTWSRLENVTLHTQNGQSIDVNTHLELDLCAGETYVFLEKYFNDDYYNLKPEDLKEKIAQFAGEFNIEESSVRAFQVQEIEKYRKKQGDMLLNIGKEVNLKPTQLVLWTQYACGDAIDAGDDENAAEILGAASSQDGKHIIVGQARIRKEDILAEQTATPAPEFRTTRMVKDGAPYVYNKIKEFDCSRGKHCKHSLTVNTFLDHEDGNLLNLQSKVFSAGSHPNVFTVTRRGDNIALEGVPLTSGSFEFRFEVRDSSNQPGNDVFTVRVNETHQTEPNHLFELLLDAKHKKFAEKPELLLDFIKKIAKRVNGNPQDVQIDSVVEEGSQSILRWSNSSLSRNSCIEKSINETYAKMVGKGQPKKVLEFAKYLGKDFGLKEVSIKLQGTCINHPFTPQIKRVTVTTSRPTQDEEGGVSSLLLIVLAIVTIVLLLIILVIVCICFKKKQAPKKSQEYTTKGTPIVFPDDVQQDDETNGATAAVTTPMLVTHEHPPLNPTTLHENPIYKPPSEHGTPNRNAMGKRLPPPYVAP